MWIGEVVVTDEPDGGRHLVVRSCGEEKWFPIHTLDERGPHRWEGFLRTGEETVGAAFLVRPTLEGDAVVAVTAGSLPRIPMPIEVIRGTHEVCFVMPELLAAETDHGEVTAVILFADEGMYVREASRWCAFHDASVTADLRLEPIPASGLEVYDRLSASGETVRLVTLGWQP